MTAEQEIFAFILILARVSTFVAFLPLFARRQLPHLVKAGLAVSLTIFWYGCLPQESMGQIDINLISSALYLVKESAFGLVLSMLVGFMLVPARIAGAYVGQEIGLSLASVSSPGTSDSSTLVTTIFETFAVLLFFGLDMHHFMIALLHYSLLDVGSSVSLVDLPAELMVQFTGSLTEQGSLIIGPVGICLMILTVGLSLLNKAAPTLNLFSVGMTLRSGLGILCLIVFFPLVIHSMEMYLRIHQARLEELLAYFGS